MAKRPAATPEPPRPEPEAVFPIASLDAVLGQQHARRTLESALRSGRVPHAWIFHGPQGVGKFTAAVAFAATLLSDRAPESAAARLIRSGTHPDLHIIRKELAAMSEDQEVRDRKQTTIPVQVVRQFLIEPALRKRNLPGTSAVGKVFIVDEAELMAPVSQNAVLKVLEEPPEGTAVILITASQDRMLPTIRSRCQRVGFFPLDDADMEHWLKGRPDARALAAAERRWVLKFAAGSPGAAVLAIEHGLIQWSEPLSPMLDALAEGRFSPDLGSVMSKLVGERAEAAVKANPEASKDAANKAWCRRLLAYIAEDARARLCAAQTGPAPNRSDPDAGSVRLIHILECITEAERQLASNVNFGLVFENFAAQAAAEPLPI